MSNISDLGPHQSFSAQPVASQPPAFQPNQTTHKTQSISFEDFKAMKFERKALPTPNQPRKTTIENRTAPQLAEEQKCHCKKLEENNGEVSKGLKFFKNKVLTNVIAVGKLGLCVGVLAGATVAFALAIGAGIAIGIALGVAAIPIGVYKGFTEEGAERAEPQGHHSGIHEPAPSILEEQLQRNRNHLTDTLQFLQSQIDENHREIEALRAPDIQLQNDLKKDQYLAFLINKESELERKLEEDFVDPQVKESYEKFLTEVSADIGKYLSEEMESAKQQPNNQDRIDLLQRFIDDRSFESMEQTFERLKRIQELENNNSQLQKDIDQVVTFHDIEQERILAQAAPPAPQA